MLVFGSLLLIPIFLLAHPPLGRIAHDFVVPKLPGGGKLNENMLLIIVIVGTTVAPWQLFFQQSYVVGRRITPRFVGYARADLWIGIVLVIIGAVAMMAFTEATFAGRPEFGNFQDAGAVAAGLGTYVGRAAGVFFAVALINASVIGAMAVSLSTAYAIGDVLSLRHSLHRKPKDAKAFYAVYGGLVALAAILVLTPGTPLGLLTNAVQTLAGVLLPNATVFLLLLCNDLEGGAQALSEIEFLRFCVRHGLPRPTLQVRHDSAGRRHYLDATFRRRDSSVFHVEVDGGIHLKLEVRSKDDIKDNDAKLDRKLVLRYTSFAIYTDQPDAVRQITRAFG